MLGDVSNLRKRVCAKTSSSLLLTPPNNDARKKRITLDSHSDFNLDLNLLPLEAPIMRYILDAVPGEPTFAFEEDGDSMATDETVNSMTISNRILMPEAGRRPIHDSEILLTIDEDALISSEPRYSWVPSFLDDTSFDDPGLHFSPDGNIVSGRNANPFANDSDYQETELDYSIPNYSNNISAQSVNSKDTAGNTPSRDVQKDRGAYENMNDNLLINSYNGPSDTNEAGHYDLAIGTSTYGLDLDLGSETVANQNTQNVHRVQSSSNIENQTRTNRQSTNSKRRCCFDLEIIISKSEFEYNVQNYLYNMDKARSKRRKLNYGRKSHNMISFNQFAFYAIETPFSIFYQNANNFAVNTLIKNKKEEEITDGTPKLGIVSHKPCANSANKFLSSETLGNHGDGISDPFNWISSGLDNIFNSDIASRTGTLQQITGNETDNEGIKAWLAKQARDEKLIDREQYELDQNDNYTSSYGQDFGDQSDNCTEGDGVPLNNSVLESRSFPSNGTSDSLNLNSVVEKHLDQLLNQETKDFKEKTYTIPTVFNNDQLFLRYAHKRVQKLNKGGHINNFSGKTPKHIGDIYTGLPEQEISQEHSDYDWEVASNTYQETENNSFNTFLHHKSGARGAGAGAGNDFHQYILFEDLFPIKLTTKRQAAAAFFQVLKMATNNKIKVKQGQPIEGAFYGNSREKKSGIMIFI